MTPATQVAAGGGDALVGGIVGGIIGGAIVNDINRKKTVTRRVYVQPSMTSAQREANREVQVALNYFGYPVGSPDGVLGRNSRAAISEYQVTLGYAGTGQLSEFERSHLVGSYHRAVAGGALTLQQAAANPMGMRGLLVAWRDEAVGLTAPQPAVPAAPATTEAAMPEAPAEPAPAPAPGLPTFLGNGAVTEASLASHCNRIGLATTASGGYTTVATMVDPAAALGEQFCLVRSVAIASGEEMARAVPGVTPEAIAQQCDGFGPAMQAQVAALSLEPAPAVLEKTRAFALTTGMSQQQLAATAKICLSVGYSQDKMDVALASALLLAGLGQGAYGEIVGHHLSQGFGTVARPDLAFDWYDMSLTAAAQPGAVAFVPGQPDRMQLVRKAAYAIAGRPDQAQAAPAVLPTFALTAPAAPAPTEAPAAATELALAPLSLPAATQPATTPAAAPAVEPTLAAAPAEAAPASAGASLGMSAVSGLAHLPQLLFRN
ncbi:MAG: peptidoglycan-binding protein [Rhodobacteraceae bacterium]|nr:peptidoglycan-binding protein [Paracoccaceae bacterium]